MVEPKHARPRQDPSTALRSADLHYLSKLASALEPYGVRTRLVEDGTPYLWVSNPDSDYAVEHIGCECRSYEYAFVASFGACLGTSRDIEYAAERTAWLLGATAF